LKKKIDQHLKCNQFNSIQTLMMKLYTDDQNFSSRIIIFRFFLVLIKKYYQENIESVIKMPQKINSYQEYDHYYNTKLDLEKFLNMVACVCGSYEMKNSVIARHGKKFNDIFLQPLMKYLFPDFY